MGAAGHCISQSGRNSAYKGACNVLTVPLMRVCVCLHAWLHPAVLQQQIDVLHLQMCVQHPALPADVPPAESHRQQLLPAGAGSITKIACSYSSRCMVAGQTSTADAGREELA